MRRRGRVPAISIGASASQVDDGDTLSYSVHIDNTAGGADAAGVVVRQSNNRAEDGWEISP